MPKTTPLQTPLLLQIEVAQNKTVLTPDTPGLDRARYVPFLAGITPKKS